MKTAYSVEVKHNTYYIDRGDVYQIFMDEKLIGTERTLQDAFEFLCNKLAKRLNKN